MVNLRRYGANDENKSIRKRATSSDYLKHYLYCRESANNTQNLEGREHIKDN